MHLRSHPKPLRSELHLDATRVQTSSRRSIYFGSQQEVLMRKMSSKPSNISTGRIPLSFISTNTLCYSTSGTSVHLKAPCSTKVPLVPSPTGSRYNTPPAACRTATDDADVTMNMWTVIKPGHVREKIAMFASEGRRAVGADGGARSSASCLSRCDAAVMACTNGTGQFRAVKAKGSWEENSSAKRRRRSLNNQNHEVDQRSRFLSEQQCDLKPKPRCSESNDEQCGEAPVSAEEEQKISVGEMVAFLEHRASELQPSLKPLFSLQRSSTSITLSKTSRPEIREGEEPEIVRVSEMVAKLESECLRSTESSLSRSNSLKRTVGRVLLAAGQKSFSHSGPQSETASAPPVSSSAPPQTLNCSKKPVSSSQTLRAESPATAAPPSADLIVKPQEVPGEPAALALQSEEQEPPPGLLFLSPDKTESKLCTPHYRSSFYLEPTLPPASSQQSEKNKDHKPTGFPLSRSASVSQDFLKVRQRLQQLLAPQSYLLLLPHHLLVKMFLLLPTQSLAALKCTCSYFKFIIENYGVRPADSLWVSDPRYRDDPCKQCKKRYCPGDVSLCRWHHKPYCQALPYGPGYWMCCHGAQKDAPGCNVGLHDNCWVPAFHSINVPIYRRNYSHES